VRGAVVALDVHLTPELELEGRARDLVRQIQELRKEADLNIADRIRVSIKGAEDILAAHEAYVKNETLTREIAPTLGKALLTKSIDIGGKSVEIGLERA
jgi:isoleucyl-tRNA synthetase